MNEQPLVTVLLATYHWTSVLHYAIQTVLWQTFTDFELLVIGDGCTDNTAEIVASFDDPRVHWHNLPENTGSQAGPNNAGLAMARGQYIAYAHQDDLWLPNHLQVLIDALNACKMPLAHTLMLDVGPAPDSVRRVMGLPNTGKFGAEKRFLATPMIMHRTEVARTVGGWRDWKQTIDPPTIDLWKRILGPAEQMASVTEVTVIKFNSADRRNSYVEQKSDEQADYFERIRNQPDFLYREVLTALDHKLRGWQIQSLVPPKPAHMPAGWLMDQYRQLRGLEATAIPTAAPTATSWRSRVIRPIRWVRDRMPQSLRKRIARLFVKVSAFIERTEDR
jgi:glycosyltransferase involved in cell wall biosynthesis